MAAPGSAAAAAAAGGGMELDIPSLRVGTGTAAITMFAGFFFALVTVLIVTIIHFTERSTKLLIGVTCIVAIITFISARSRPRDYAFSLLSMACFMVAVVLGFMIDGPLSITLKIVAMGLVVFAGICKLRYFYF
jgi:Ca2+/Na+ antiporter